MICYIANTMLICGLFENPHSHQDAQGNQTPSSFGHRICIFSSDLQTVWKIEFLPLKQNVGMSHDHCKGPHIVISTNKSLKALKWHHL